MKALLVSTPVMGHLNPLLSIGRILVSDGHEVVGLSSTYLHDRIEAIGATFRGSCRRRISTSGTPPNGLPS